MQQDVWQQEVVSSAVGLGWNGSEAGKCQTAVVNAVRRSQPSELDKNVLKLWSGISSMADSGGSERRELGDGSFGREGPRTPHLKFSG